jgi:hypothetical protein
MKFMLLIYGNEAAWFNQSQAELSTSYQAYMDYSNALVEAGVMRDGAELKPVATATTVRVQQGKTVMTDGPFIETKEQLGGYYLIETATLDEALKWAAKCPGAAHGGVEVRPLVEHEQNA